MHGKESPHSFTRPKRGWHFREVSGCSNLSNEKFSNVIREERIFEVLGYTNTAPFPLTNGYTEIQDAARLSGVLASIMDSTQNESCEPIDSFTQSTTSELHIQTAHCVANPQSDRQATNERPAEDDTSSANQGLELLANPFFGFNWGDLSNPVSAGNSPRNELNGPIDPFTQSTTSELHIQMTHCTANPQSDRQETNERLAEDDTSSADHGLKLLPNPFFGFNWADGDLASIGESPTSQILSR
jgi:hypothetical protein